MSWARAKHLLAEALDRAPAERRVYLDEACGSDSALRAEVESLLDYEARDEELLAAPLFDLAAAINRSNPPPRQAGPPISVLPPDTGLVRPAAPPFVCVALILGTVFVLMLTGTVWRIFRHGNSVKNFGWSEAKVAGAWRVATVEVPGPAAGKLRVGDTILAFDGDGRAALVGAATYRQFLPFDGSYTLRVRGIDGEHEHALWQGRAIRGAAFVAVLYCLLAVSFCMMGLIIGLSRPRDPITQIGCLAGWFAAMRLLGLGVLNYQGGQDIERILDGLLWLGEPWHLALSYHFLYLFAQPPERERVWRLLNFAIYGMCAALFLISIAIRVAALMGRDPSIALQVGHPVLGTLNDALVRTSAWDVFQLMVYAAIFSVVLRGYRHVEDPDRRRRIRWVVWGCMTAFTPLLVLLGADFLLQWVGARDIVDSLGWKNVEHGVTACMMAVPATLAYAIARHRVLGIQMVVRRSMQRVLAARVFQALLLLLAAVLLLPVLRDFRRPLSELYPASSLLPNLLVAGALAVGLARREQLHRWLDRRFFREAYVQERLLRETLARIKDADSFDEVARVVGETLMAALHPSFLCVVNQVSHDGRPVVTYRSEGASPRVAMFALATSRKLQREHRRAPISLSILAERDQDTSALAVPIVGSGTRPVGCLLLGEKRSEEPYGETDLDLLAGIADQTAVVQEKLQLTAIVDDADRVMECPACGACFDKGVKRCVVDGSRLTPGLFNDRLVASRYQLECRIDKGGMGAVYEVTDVGGSVPQPPMALKVTLNVGDPSAVARFEQEVHALHALTHPNILRIFTHGIIRDRAYLIVERVFGESWRTELDARFRLSPATLADWMDQLLDGLGAAHGAGVVHRDLKPSNVLIATDADGIERVTIIDFGLAAITDPARSEARLTELGMVLGTVGYMSPEQARGGIGDARSDLFAAGVMAMEALTGVPPPNEWPPKTWPFPPRVVDLSALAIACPRPARDALEEVLRQCLAEDPAQRVRSAREMRELLVPALRACVDDAHGSVPSAGPPQATAGRVASMASSLRPYF